MHVVVASHHRLPSRATADRSASSSRWFAGSRRLPPRDAARPTGNQSRRGQRKIVEVAPRLLKDSSADLKKFIPDGVDILHAHFP